MGNPNLRDPMTREKKKDEWAHKLELTPPNQSILILYYLHT